MKILLLSLLIFLLLAGAALWAAGHRAASRIDPGQRTVPLPNETSHQTPARHQTPADSLIWTFSFLIPLLPSRMTKLLGRDQAGWELASTLDPSLKRADYQRRYLTSRLLILYGGALLTVLVLLIYELAFPIRHPDRKGLLRQAGSGQEYSRDLTVQVDGQKEELHVDIAPRVYSQRERTVLFNRVCRFIEETLPGENPSLQDVSRPLSFPQTYPGENVSIEWECEDYNLIGQDGALQDLSEIRLPVTTRVTAVITYAGYESLHSWPVTITRYLPEDLPLSGQLQEALSDMDDASREDAYLPLPSSIDGKEITWTYTRTLSPALGLPCLLLAFLAAASWHRQRMKEAVRERQQQLTLEYPVFVHRMVLMLGAGIPPRRSWDLLVRDLEEPPEGGPARGSSPSYLLREMKYTSLQMQAGIPEIQAYRDFGKRTGLPGYEQFSQLLIQMIRKGPGGIRQMMLQQASQAQKERRDLAQALGETAGMKLLAPMGILLVVVIMIVMTPAFMEF